MSFRFRRSVRLLPGVRLNFSKSGVSASFGIRGASVTVGKSGTHLNLGIPGTGLSYRTRLDGPANRSPAEPARKPDASPRKFHDQFQHTSPNPPNAQPGTPLPLDGLNYTGRREYRSAHPDTLSSRHLQQLADLVSEVEARRARINKAIAECRERTEAAKRRLKRGRSLLLRAFFSKRRLDEISDHVGRLEALSEEVSNTLEGTVIDADFELPDEARSEYLHLLDAYAKLTSAQRIWDVATSSDINRAVTRSAASSAITRTLVQFATAKIAEMDSDFEAMHLANANGGDLYLYPGLLAVRKPRDGFALLDMRDIDISVRPSSFVEEESLPADAEQIGHVWAKANKDGSPDRRFRGNYQIPLMRYGEMSLRSKTGLNEVYMVSDWRALSLFQQALLRYTAALPRTKGVEGEGPSDVPYEAVPDLEVPSIPGAPSLHTAGSTFRFLAFGLAIAALLYGTQDRWHLSPRSDPIVESGAATAPAEAPTSAPTPATVPTSPNLETGTFGAPPAATGAPLTPDETMELQMRLVTLGFKPGPVDGDLGGRTIDAFNQWRIQNGRTRLQAIDQVTYRDFLDATN
jgi:hypothetical protein